MSHETDSAAVLKGVLEGTRQTEGRLLGFLVTPEPDGLHIRFVPADAVQAEGR